jgi:hypothetical protein
MNLSVLIPWRTDNGPRQAAFDYLIPRWEATGVDVCVGQDDPDGPFNCARAQNRAFRQARHDLLIMFGADQVPPTRTELLDIELRLSAEPWIPLMAETGYYSRESTDRILAGADPFVEPLEYTLPFCTGVIGVTRRAYEDAGGMDERFSGWGYEDAAFRQTLAGLFGAPPALPYTLRCLWHRTDHRTAVSPNQVLMRDYTPLTEPVSTRAYLDERGSFVA